MRFGAGALGAVIGSQFFLMTMGLIHIRWLEYQRKVDLERSRKGDYLGAFLPGLTFSFGRTPCIGPVLGAVLGLSASSSQPLYGGFLMAVYALGLMIPFSVLALFSDALLTRVKKLRRHPVKIKNSRRHRHHHGDSADDGQSQWNIQHLELIGKEWNGMKRTWITAPPGLALLSLAACGALGAVSQTDAQEDMVEMGMVDSESKNQGEPAPDFERMDLDGNTVKRRIY